MPLHSLRVRLVLTMLAILAITIGAAALLFSRLTRVTLDRYLVADRLVHESRWGDLLVAHHARAGGWAGVEPVLDQIKALAGRTPVLLDSLDHLVAPRDLGLKVVRGADGDVRIERRGARGETMRFAFHGVQRIVGRDGRPIGRLLYLPGERPERALGFDTLEPHSARALMGSMNRSLALAVVAVGVLALLLTAALARRVLAPVEALTAAVRNLEPGREPPRVEVRGRDEIAALAGAFNAMAGRVTFAERLRRDLVSDVAHELRTPLHNLRGQIEALQDGLAQPDAARLASLHEEVVLLGRMVDDLQDLSQADAGQLRLSRRALTPRAEIERAVASIVPRAGARGVALSVDAPHDLPAVDADPARLAQVLRNLLDNAVAHTPSEGGVRVRARSDGARVAFEVHDTGSGIATEHLPYVFDRFYRTDPSRSRDTGGAGLGLAIVKQLVEAHGGEVGVTSTASGSTFVFKLPVAASS